MTDLDELITEIFEENSNELMKFLQKRGDPFSGFILLFSTMVQLANNFERPFFKDKISDLFDEELNLKTLIKGILDLNNKINSDSEEARYDD